jgi:hypothetical protein
MAKLKEPLNPFYVLLVLVGVVFFVTAFAYGAMTYLAIQPGAPGREAEKHELWGFLDRHGMQLMGAELAVLAGATFGAMWLDGYRMRRDSQESKALSGQAGGAEPGREIR